MYNTHSPAEWAAAFCLGTSISAAVSIPFWLFVDAALADFDPRPLIVRALENRVGGQFLCDVTGARYALRDGLLGVDLFLSPIAAPKGALR